MEDGHNPLSTTDSDTGAGELVFNGIIQRAGWPVAGGHTNSPLYIKLISGVGILIVLGRREEVRERAQGRNWSLKTSRTWIISLQFSTLASLQLWVPFPSLSLFLNYLFRFQLTTFVILFWIISVERLNSGSLGFILGFWVEFLWCWLVLIWILHHFKETFHQIEQD